MRESSLTALHAQEIHTARLVLVPLKVEHADEMADVLADPALHTFIGGSPDDPQALRARYLRMTAGSPDPAVSWCNWVLRLRDEDCLAGTVQATVGPTADGSDRGGALVAEIAWVVGTPWQGRGIAAEAARGLVGWLAGQRAVRCVVAHVHPDHLASAAVATAAGLSPTDEWQDGEVKWQRTMER
ncbi:GNAT family N-acetyltransferase [Streptomyces durmitorensis]|uniref:GNAT family N-acetyltransferase n=1 Tax=Streptomyces durmitorensis TaxID=319947 RepID=A0ABY4PN62_9ACTN|nr:GNAT family N-acetyltransferase [Streptomyces durmitorensis]UQT54279.1 GNAT family N-acetyltransferase [Streptomyces durmitorensis]